MKNSREEEDIVAEIRYHADDWVRYHGVDNYPPNLALALEATVELVALRKRVASLEANQTAVLAMLDSFESTIEWGNKQGPARDDVYTGPEAIVRRRNSLYPEILLVKRTVMKTPWEETT